MELFGTDGIRARAGEGPLTDENVKRIGMAVGYLLKSRAGVFATPAPKWFHERHRTITRNILGKDRVLIGRDTRPSGDQIERELVKGLTVFGIPVLSAGVIPTPGISFLTRQWSCLLGIVISASHNPAEDNGIKLISPKGLKVSDEAEQAVEELYGKPDFAPNLVHSHTRRVERPRDAADRAEEYVRWLAGRIDRKHPLKGMRIVVDGAHGAAAKMAPELLRREDVDVVTLNEPVDGSRINEDCGATHPEKLAAKTVEAGADLGVAFDGDGDRALFADEKGNIIDGDHLLLMHAIDLDSRDALPEKSVVGTVMTNFGLERALKERGLKLLRSKVGDRFVLEQMLLAGALLGGEPSGHVIYLDDSPSGDGILSLLRTLSLMKRTGRKLSDLASDLRKFPQVLLNVRVRSKPPLEEIPPVRQALANVENELQDRGHVVLRYSGTEPLCRVMVEGPDEAEVRKLAKSIADAVRKAIGRTTSTPV